MNNILLVLAVLVLIAGGAYAITTRSTGSPAPAAPTDQAVQPAPEQTTPAASIPESSPASRMTIDIKDFAFSPARISVKAGTTVTWMNSDNAPHTVTSDSGDLLRSPTLARGQSFSFTFTTPGTASYHCAVHPMMKGTVTVTE